MTAAIDHNVEPVRRALYVSAFFPDERATHAGGQAAFQNRIDLQRQGFHVTSLVCTTERNAWQAQPHDAVFRQTPVRLLLGWAGSLARGHGFGLLAWPWLDTRANTAFEDRLRAEVTEGTYELVFADFTQSMLPLRRALRGISPRPLTRVCAHDVYAQKLIRHGGMARFFLGPVMRVERGLMQGMDEVVMLSSKDESLVRTLYDCARVDTKAFVPPAWVAGVCRRPTSIVPGEMLFFANFDRPENAEAAAWFVGQSLPSLAVRHPGVHLVLAGAGSDRVALPASQIAVRRLGYLEDPGPAFARCDLAIAPLAQGAGIKFKVLEALACGVPVVGTPIALEGIARSSLVYEATRDRFADTLARLLVSP